MSDRLITIAMVVDQTGRSKATIYRLLKTPGAFPQPRRDGAFVRWSENEVQTWIAAELEKRPAGDTSASAEVHA